MRPIWISIFATAMGSGAMAQQVAVTVSNPASFPRKQETVVLRWDQLRLAAPRLDPAGAAVIEKTARMISQSVDTDGDGKPDELLFQSDFAPRQSKIFTIRNDAIQRPARSLVDARFVLPRQDLAWENDRVAFRIYGSELAGDVRNGIDVWTKRVRSLIVEKWYRESEGRPPGKDSYHEDRGEGADFFSVGKTLGAGGCGLWANGKLHQSGLFSAHRIIATGPIRVLFEVRYEGGSVEGRPFKEVKRVSLDAGSDLNRIEERFTGPGVGPEVLCAAGLVRRWGVTGSSDTTGYWLALYGPVNRDSVNGTLGTAILVPHESFAGETSDSAHVMLLGRPDAGGKFTYYAGAGWSRMGDHPNADSWASALRDAARRIAQPLIVRIPGLKKNSKP